MLSRFLRTGLLADRAAAALDPVADPAQWVYRKSAVVPVPEVAGEPEVTERWTTADGTAAAAYAGDDAWNPGHASSPALRSSRMPPTPPGGAGQPGHDLAGENAWGVAILEIVTVTGPGRYP
jgi:hypothetical protein